jgi:transposase
LLTGHEQAMARGKGGAFLCRERLDSSLITAWRRARDAGLLAGKAPGESVGRPSAERAEVARLRRELEVTRTRLATTQTALEVGDGHNLIRCRGEYSGRDP